MSAPTITPAARTVSEEVIDCYTQDAKILGLDAAAGIAGVLAAYVDTYFGGRHDTLNITGRETLMAEKIEQAFALIHDLPCLCDQDGLCRRCQVIGEDELLDIPVDAAAEARTARIVADGLAGLELPADQTRAISGTISGTITIALWMANLLASSVDTHATVTRLQLENSRLRERITSLTQIEVDPEQCGACVDMDNGGPCPFHAGHLAGALHVAEAIGAICQDIELADLVHELTVQREH